MADREKVIKGLECLAQKPTASPNPCRYCGYSRRVNFDFCVKDVAADALELLKAQDDIVKCKTCKYWDDTSEGRYIGGWCFCDRLKFSTSPEWYCADGEGKTDAVY